MCVPSNMGIDPGANIRGCNLRENVALGIHPAGG